MTVANSKQITPSDEARLKQVVQQMLDKASALGASAVEVGASIDAGLSTTVRMGEVETVEFNRDKGIGITAYFGHRKGAASTSDLSDAAIESTVKAACDIAKLTGEDECSGLADKELIAFDYPDLDLCHPWGLDAEHAILKAKQCEDMARAYDKRIENSEGASVSSHQSYRVYGNSYGFIGAFPTSRHSVTCVLVAKESGKMQRDYYYTTARDPHALESLKAVAEKAAKRTVDRLGAQKIKTCQVPVIFTADIAKGLIGSFLGAISGGNLYRKSSFLLDKLNEQIFPKSMHIFEKPHIQGGLGSSPFDGDGVKTVDRDIVIDGVLQSYLLSTYSARKLGMQSTGNAGGIHNLFVKHDDLSFAGLVKRMDKGLIVNEVMGHGVNILTGDYSRGASGFWVENGEIQYPVEEITIAGSLPVMFKQFSGIANDVDTRSSVQTGSIMIEQMMIAGG